MGDGKKTSSRMKVNTAFDLEKSRAFNNNITIILEL